MTLKDKSGLSFHDQIAHGLAEVFSDAKIEPSSIADVIIDQGERIVIVEVKTGDPDLPLPSSALAQMKLAVQDAQRKLEQRPLDKEVVPIIVTNYKVYPEQQQELKEDGITVVSLKSSSDFAKVVSELTQATGLSLRNQPTVL